MQNLVKLFKQFKKESPPPTPQELLNRCREYLQITVLKSIYHSKYGTGLSFMGETCLRICYNLKRYSEDLDFALDREIKDYTFSNLVEVVSNSLEETGLKVTVKVKQDDVVQKSFLKFEGLLYSFDLSPRKDQKLQIKMEIDTHPVKIDDNQRESFFVSKYNENYPILKHKKETLFAGKLLAILSRIYAKGRDYYDLIWYLSKRTPIDMKYLNDGIEQANRKLPSPLPTFSNEQELFAYLTKMISRIDVKTILKDIGRFLEDPMEEKWIRNYQQVFTQLVNSYGS